MKKIRTGIIGMGFIGGSHIDAVRRIPGVELVAVADENAELARAKADMFAIDKCYSNAVDLINDPDIDVVHDCTPNNLHLFVNEKAILAGKHIFSEKPLGLNSQESGHMTQLLKSHPDVVAGVNYCYRMNALLQDAKLRIKDGEIGRPLLVHGSYLQDWLLYETDYNWRIEPEISGASRCVADIGSHWMDTAQTLLSSRIVSVCADTEIILPVRKKPKGQVESFAVNTSGEYEEKPITTEDYAAVLLKFDNGVNGVFHCSQVSAGRKCFISVEIDGSEASVAWQHENSDRMWKGNRNKNNEEIFRNPNLMRPEARKYAYLSAGHPEGWNDAFKNNLSAFYTFIQKGLRPGVDKCDFATFADAHYLIRVTEAILESGRKRGWVDIEP